MRDMPAVVQSTVIENGSMQGIVAVIHLGLTGCYLYSPLFASDPLSQIEEAHCKVMPDAGEVISYL
jgi:hypothetical protein